MNRSISYNLPVMITKQGRRFVAYTPALDISTSGRSERDVQKKFSELAGIFFEEIIEAGTADQILSELGWKKIQKKWNPPRVINADSIGVRVPAFV